jgi:thiol:disulfide interchange protein
MRVHSPAQSLSLILFATAIMSGCQSATPIAPTIIPASPVPATSVPTQVSSSASTANVLKPYDETANAHQAIRAALALAKIDHKYVLLDFGGNWCPDCIVLAKLYQTDPLKSFVDKNYHIVSIDIGQFDKNLDIDTQYSSPITNGVPAVVVLDASGKMIGSTGDGALESARDMNAQQVLAILEKWAPTQS